MLYYDILGVILCVIHWCHIHYSHTHWRLAEVHVSGQTAAAATQDSSNGGAVETGCCDLYDVIY